MPIHRIGAMVMVDPKEARVRIVAAFSKARCHLGTTAEVLGCERHTLMRWIKALDLKPDLEKISTRAEREGWHHGRKGGAADHLNPEARVRKARETRERRKAATPPEEGSS